MKYLLCFLIFWVTLPLSAFGLELDGDAVQGALIRGKVDAGYQVFVDEQKLKLSSDGQFVFGIGRDAGPVMTLRIEGLDGKVEQQKIVVQKRDWKISKIDGLPQRKVTPKPEDIARIKKDNQAIGRVRKMSTDRMDFAKGFIWPAVGRISGVFGSQRILNGVPKRYHNGLDIAAPTGTLIKAPASGRVVLVHPDMFYSGQTVMLDHGFGITSVYIHMSETLVTEGQDIAQGDPIGKIGTTGRSTGPHLHWGVSWFGTHIDPRLLLKDPMPAN